MTEKGNAMTELSNEKWLWHLALCDNSHHLNTKLQGQHKLVYDVFHIRSTVHFDNNSQLIIECIC
jgi:hypothetical protein